MSVVAAIKVLCNSQKWICIQISEAKVRKLSITQLLHTIEKKSEPYRFYLVCSFIHCYEFNSNVRYIKKYWSVLLVHFFESEFNLRISARLVEQASALGCLGACWPDIGLLEIYIYRADREAGYFRLQHFNVSTNTWSSINDSYVVAVFII